MIEIRWVMGLSPFGPGYWLATGTTLICFGTTGIAARLILGQTLPALAVALSAGMVSYALMLYVARARMQLSRAGRGTATGLREAACRLEPATFPASGTSRRRLTGIPARNVHGSAMLAVN